MKSVLTYIATLVVYVLIDGTWLTVMGARLYRPALGDILLPTLKLPPAVAFYLLYPVGVVVLAALPAARQGTLSVAIINGVVLGAVAYGTYDLTNFATLRNWTTQITVIDIIYGAIATAVAASAGFYAARLLSR